MKNKNGYTLIELLASITILTLVITAFIPIFSTIVQWTNKSEDELIAANLLGEIANDLKQLPDDFPIVNIRSCNNDFSLISHYDTYIVNSQEYYVDLQICQEEQVSLYRTNMQVYTNEGNLVSESFTYVPFGEQS